ncbi:MAG: KH domain-containing protein [Candidatus Dependentiae bacterium]|nr:KH domain-containing protein [Candidatus Dependentiae bacterium]
MIKELVEYVVVQLVHDPESVQVSIVQDNDVRTVNIKVSARDRGRLIGKRGQTIRAIRTLVDTVISAEEKISVRVAD